MFELTPKSFTEFQQEAQKGNVVPVVRSVLADLHTPVSAFMRVANDPEQAFLLESIEGGEKIARYSFLAANPFMTVRSNNSQTILEKDGKEEILNDKNIIEFLRKHFAQNKLANRENLPPLCGGAVGFFGYGSSRWFEKVLDDGKVSEEDDALWMFFRNVLVFDRLKQRIEIVSIVLTDEAENDDEKLKTLYENAVTETANIEKLLLQNSLPIFAENKSKKMQRASLNQIGQRKISSKRLMK